MIPQQAARTLRLQIPRRRASLFLVKFSIVAPSIPASFAFVIFLPAILPPIVARQVIMFGLTLGAPQTTWTTSSPLSTFKTWRWSLLGWFLTSKILAKTIPEISRPLYSISSIFLNSELIGILALIFCVLVFFKFAFKKNFQKFTLEKHHKTLVIYFLFITLSLFASQSHEFPVKHHVL